MCHKETLMEQKICSITWGCATKKVAQFFCTKICNTFAEGFALLIKIIAIKKYEYNYLNR